MKLKITNIYRLLDIKSDSKVLWILIFPPIYSLWLLAIGKKLLGKQRKSDRFFSILVFLFFILNLIILIALPFVDVNFYNVHRTEYLVFMKIYFLLYLISILILTNITVKYDRSKNEDKYYSIIYLRDYIWRFFGFIYWPFFIWTYQKTVNEYNKN